MALITIIVHDTPAGPHMQIFAEPELPKNILEGRPTDAQAVAAVMLNAVQVAQSEAAQSRIQLLDN